MKSIDAIFKFGNLYDRVTKQRIILKDEAKVCLVVNHTDLLEVDPNIKPVALLNSFDKEEQIDTFILKEGKGNYWKLLDEGSLLIFKITAGIKQETGTRPYECTFEVRLLEDLYIYNKREDPEYARFFECHCIVQNCSSGFDYFEAVHATSLNDAYTKTYELYFAMFGKSTCNAFDRFTFIPESGEPASLRKLSVAKQAEKEQDK